MADKAVIHDLTEGSTAKQMIKFAVPFMLTNLLNTLYTLVDLAVVGKYTDSAGVSAVSIAGSVTMLLYAVGIGFGNGGGIFIAQMTGAKRFKDLNETIGTLVSFCIAAGIVLVVIGYYAAQPVLYRLNTPEEAFDLAVSYMRICLIGIPFTFCFGTFSDTLRGMGDSLHPLIIAGVSMMTNVMLDILFVAGFHWGSSGAAWATITAQILSFVFALLFLYRRRKEIHFDFKPHSFLIRWDKLRIAAKLSLPLIFMSVAIEVSMMYVNSYVNSYGIVAAAVAGIGSKLTSVRRIVTSSIQNATSSMVGQNMGAGKTKRARKTVYIGWAICLSFWVVLSIFELKMPDKIFGIFSNDKKVLDLSWDYMRIGIWMSLATSLMSPALGLINGVGNTMLNMVIAILDGVIARIGLSMLLGVVLGMGLRGFWLGNALAGYVSVILAGVYFFFGKWEDRKLLRDEVSTSA